MEIWKTIEDLGTPYEVSNLGRIRSMFNGTERILKSHNHNEYKRISFGNGKNKKRFPVHRLVALAFIPAEDSKSFVNHKNLDRSDNRVENLEWCTARENSAHYYQSGEHPKSSKTVGVSYEVTRTSKKRWKADIWMNKKTVVIGRFLTEQEAIDARLNFQSSLI